MWVDNNDPADDSGYVYTGSNATSYAYNTFSFWVRTATAYSENVRFNGSVWGTSGWWTRPTGTGYNFVNNAWEEVTFTTPDVGNDYTWGYISMSQRHEVSFYLDDITISNQ